MDIEDGDHDEHLEEEDRQEEPEEGGHDIVQQSHTSALLGQWLDIATDIQDENPPELGWQWEP